MASMTDVIFLLLIFFMVVSTLVVPNAIKVNLPSSQSAKPQEAPQLKVTIDAENRYFISFLQEAPSSVSPEELQTSFRTIAAQDSTAFVALYADENIPYRSIVEVLNMASEAHMKIVLATRSLKSDNSSKGSNSESPISQ